MTTLLTNKTAIVTAAAQGIGRATALAFANAGAKVFALDINGVQAGQLENEHGNIISQRLDVLDQAAIDALIPSLGPIDILFNCAGFADNDTILSVDMEHLDFAFDLNVKSMIRMSKAVLPSMLQRKHGVIINVASISSSVKGMPESFSFSTTKAAVIGLTKSIAAEYVSQGIRCNAICPGTIQTPSFEDRLSKNNNYEAVLKAFIATQPMAKIGTAEEVAALGLYLAGATYTTGQAYNIDGGCTI